MSAGFKEAKGSWAIWKSPEIPEEANSPVEACGMLSITYKGWLSPRKELAPRIVMEEAAPGVAEAVFTTKPATLPSNRLSIEVAFMASSPSGRIVVNAPVKSPLRAVP